MDNDTFIEVLKQKAVEFRDRRNWKQFHDLKNLAIGLSVESAELMELFLWKSVEEINAMLSLKGEKTKIADELADIFIFLMYICEAADVDLATAVHDKINANEKKYPVDKSYNSSRKYTEL